MTATAETWKLAPMLGMASTTTAPSSCAMNMAQATMRAMMTSCAGGEVSGLGLLRITGVSFI